MLGQDGRHVSLGRTVPADEEIAAASEALPAQGLGGWLVAMDSTYSGRGRVMLAQLHTIGAAADLDWPVAVTAFLDARQRALRMWSFD